MKNNDDIPTTDATEIKQLINRVKQGKLDQGDAQLIEKLLNILLTIVSLLERKHTSLRRMKELLFGMKEKKRGKQEAKNRAEDGRSGADGSSQTDSLKETASHQQAIYTEKLRPSSPTVSRFPQARHQSDFPFAPNHTTSFESISSLLYCEQFLAFLYPAACASASVLNDTRLRSDTFE